MSVAVLSVGSSVVGLGSAVSSSLESIGPLLSVESGGVRSSEPLGFWKSCRAAGVSPAPGLVSGDSAVAAGVSWDAAPFADVGDD
jgi:hypothetical protein